MNTRKYIIPLLAISLTACTEYIEKPLDIEETTDGIIDVSVNAAGTRTSLEGTTLSWEKGDVLGLFIQGVQDNSPLTNSGSSSVTNFTGGIPKQGIDPCDVLWAAYYPKQSACDGSTVIAELPRSQAAPFDASANFMVSTPVSHNYNENGMDPVSMVFDRHLFGLIKVRIVDSSNPTSTSRVSKVDITSDEGKTMSGSFTFDVFSPLTSLSFKAGSSYPNVMATYETASVIGSGKEIYLFVKPDTYNGLTLKVQTEDEGIREFHTSSTVTINAGDLATFPDADIAGKTPKRVKVLACWGDSFTNAGYSSYPVNLQSLLGVYWKIYNGGISGNRVEEIAARQGGLPIVTGEEFVLPASGTVTTEGIYRTKSNSCEDGYYHIRLYSGAMSNPCLIECNGAQYKCNIISTASDLYDTGYNDPSITYTATVSRLEAGEAVTIPAHSKIISYGAQVTKDADLQIIYMGTNGVVTYPGKLGDDCYYDNLVEYHKYMINFNTNKSDYLILGYHTWDWNTYYWQRFAGKEFGEDRMIDLRHLIPEYGRELMVLTGVYPSVADIPQSELDRIDGGEWPYCFWHTTTDVHPSEYGAKAIAIIIHDRMRKLGYIQDDYILPQK